MSESTNAIQGMAASTIDRLRAIERLPTLPIVAQQILTLTSNPRSNMSQISTIISRDQSIAAQVIRVVNSAYYGLRTQAGSIQHAIVILGLNTVKNLVAGVSVIKTFGDSAKASIFDRERFWLHSFGCARVAKLIAEKTGRQNPGGLLSGRPFARHRATDNRSVLPQ